MAQSAIFWPVIAQVALTYAIYFLMSKRRMGAIRDGKASVSQFRENQNEPPESLFVRNNLANQFELPVLFFAACLSLHAVGLADTLSIILAWLFVASRYVHAWIHVTTNRIRHRRPLFIVGFFVLGFMWLRLAAGLAGIA